MSTHETTEKKHTGFGEKVKGAAHIVHGIGEDFRGSVMGAFESVSGSDEAKAKDEDIATKGKAEIARGVAQMKGSLPPSSATGPHSDAKTDERSGQSTREEVVSSAPAPPPSPVESRQPQPETVQQQPADQTGGTEKVQQSSTQGTQTAFETTSAQIGGEDQSGGPPGV